MLRRLARGASSTSTADARLAARGWVVTARPRITLVLGALLLAGAARADDVFTHLTGKVYEVSADASIVALLAGLGVTQGSGVSIDWVIDSTAPGQSGWAPHYTEYPGAVKSLTVVIGSCAAFYDPGMPAPIHDVLVGNDVPIGSFVADSYTVQSAGTDTGLILQGRDPRQALLLTCSFGDGDGSTLADDAPVQDVTGFSLGVGSLGGINGTIAFDIALPRRGAGPAATSIRPAWRATDGCSRARGSAGPC